jgi:hypothetical protein
VQWSGSAQVGLNASAGNARALGLSGKAQLARRDPLNRVQGASEVAVARSRVVVAEEENGTPGIGPGELREIDQTTRQSWAIGVRYDRFATVRGSVFVAGAVSADPPAGKRLQGSLQLGYGADLLSAATRGFRVEGGYDLTYEDQLSRGRPISIHSARAFAGYHAKLREELSAELSVEVLTNLNTEDSATGRVRPLGDTRTAANGSVTWKLDDRLAVGVRATALHDTAPAPRPPPPGASFEPGFAPRAEELDLTGDLVLIATFP